MLGLWVLISFVCFWFWFLKGRVREIFDDVLSLFEPERIALRMMTVESEFFSICYLLWGYYPSLSHGSFFILGRRASYASHSKE